MRVLSLKPGHDGAVALVDDGRLLFSLEAEKDSFARYAALTAAGFLEAVELADGPPDVVALGGWYKTLPGRVANFGAGYPGLQAPQRREGTMFGRRVEYFSSTHERSHLFMAAGMAPIAPVEECAILLWEGVIGTLYHWRRGGAEITPLPVLAQPGARYCALYGLADPRFPDRDFHPPHESAGRLMALAGFAGGEPPTDAERATVDRLMSMRNMYPFDKGAFRDSPLHDCGVHTPALHRAAAHLTDRIFDVFHESARTRLPRGLPLLVTGGCGLNCDWNVRWRESGLFTDVYVAPCTNDSGSAIGTAVDALASSGQPCALDWSVYSGAPFRRDVAAPFRGDWTRGRLDVAELAARLEAGDVVAWVEGRCEIGPRALGHRSLLATPLTRASHERLNAIKRREAYRPVAPCCLAEELERWFDPPLDDPYMLHFSRVRGDLPAITHADGTARVQSVRADGPRQLRALLEAFRERTGAGVLCNTSLNFPGCGFVNTASDLFAYAEREGIEHVVIDGDWFARGGRG